MNFRRKFITDGSAADVGQIPVREFAAPPLLWSSFYVGAAFAVGAADGG